MLKSLLSDGDFSFSDLSGLAFLLDVDGFLNSVHLDVSLRRKIGTDSTVSSVSSSATLGSSVNLHVIDHQVLQVLGVSVGLEVVNESEDTSD